MAKRVRRNPSSAFKAKVALNGDQGRETLTELSQQFAGAQISRGGVYYLAPDKESFSSASSPIFACSAVTSIAGAATSDFASESKTPAALQEAGYAIG